VKLIDKLGRRTLLAIGGTGYVISLGGCAWAFSSGRMGMVPPALFGFIAAHAIGQGTVIWVFISEIFPGNVRAAGLTVGCATHWLAAALLTLIFPQLAEAYSPASIFSFFCAMMILHLIWVILCVPETRGVPLEEIEALLGIKPPPVPPYDKDAAESCTGGLFAAQYSTDGIAPELESLTRRPSGDFSTKLGE